MLTPEGIARYLRENGVDYAVALAELSPITTGMMSNEGVVELCQEVDCLIPFCNVNPFLVADLAGELERYVTEMGFRGIKLYPTYQHFYRQRQPALSALRQGPGAGNTGDDPHRLVHLSKGRGSSTAIRSIWTMWRWIFPS